jgi:hypothetical protein
MNSPVELNGQERFERAGLDQAADPSQRVSELGRPRMVLIIGHGPADRSVRILEGMLESCGRLVGRGEIG